MDKKVSLPPPLDGLFPIEPKAITHIFGAPGTGKTNLCLLASLNCISAGGLVTFIDTEGGFSFERLGQLRPDYKLILNKINLLEPTSFREQGQMIRELKGTDLIIVDSLSALYRLEYAEAGTKNGRNVNPAILDASRELSKQLSILSTLARKNAIPVLATSHMFSHRDTGKAEIVGGESVKYWSKGIVLLERTGRGERKATLIKHRSLPEGKEAKFIITQDGIKPPGFKLF